MTRLGWDVTVVTDGLTANTRNTQYFKLCSKVDYRCFGKGMEIIGHSVICNINERML